MSEREGVQPIDSPNARSAAGRRFLATVPLLETFAEQIEAHLGDSPARRAQIRALLRPHLDQLEAAYLVALVRHCTTAEIEALTQFQASAAGRSVMRKQVLIQADIIPAFAPLLTSVVEEILRGTPPRKTTT